MLARLKRATRDQDGAADHDRMSLLTAPVTRASYVTFLEGIYGFEVPIESAFAMTSELGHVVDLRSRRHLRLLRADLAGLGVTDTSELDVCHSVVPFRTCGEALGWMYVIDRNLLLNGVVQRHLAQALPEQLATAYLTGGGRAVGPRLEDLGAALDGTAQTGDIADQIIDAARVAFGHQRSWFQQLARPHQHAPASKHPRGAPTFAA